MKFDIEKHEMLRARAKTQVVYNQNECYQMTNFWDGISTILTVFQCYNGNRWYDDK